MLLRHNSLQRECVRRIDQSLLCVGVWVFARALTPGNREKEV